MSSQGSFNLTRRDLLTGSAARSLPSAARGASFIRLPASAPLPDRALHLLRRTSFGVRSSELLEARSVGTLQYLEQQLDFESIPDQETEELLVARYPSIFSSVDELAQDRSPQTLGDFIDATVVRAIITTRQLYEVMVDFWTNHFSIYILKGDTAWLKLIDDREVIRRHALGSFRDLLHASAKSPAMLFYLDNHTNQLWGPNENYARELMELHTLGVDGGYVQRDVQELARVLTGWSLGSNASPFPGHFAFLPGKHDAGNKIVLGQQILSSGVREGEAVLDILASNPSTAHFIATKLCRRFVSDDPPDSIVDAATDTFLQTGGDIRAILRTILSSEEFYSSPDSKVERPFEFVVAVMRALDAFPSSRGIEEIEQTLSLLGQLPHHHLDPDGYPDEAPEWVSSDGLLSRWNFVRHVVQSPRQSFHWSLDLVLEDLVDRSPAGVADYLVERLLHRPLDAGDRDVIVAHAAQGRPPSAQLSGAAIDSTARNVAVYLLNSPYFQLR